MDRKRSNLILLALVFFLLLIVPSRVSGQTKEVCIRIPINDVENLTSTSMLTEMTIDYGAFIWSVTTPAELSKLDREGIPYQTVANPFMLRLGGQTFDPLLNPPSLPPAWRTAKEESEPGLHLVQFFGPTKSEWLASLVQEGLEILQYIHPFTYVVWGNSSTIDRSTSRNYVRWAGDYLPAYAVLPGYRTLHDASIPVRAMVYAPDGLDDTIQAIQALGGTQITTSEDPVFELLGFTIPGNQLGDIATLPGIYSLQPVPTDGGDRGELGNQVNAGNLNASGLAFPGYLNWLAGLGLFGDGVIIANVDSGIDGSHPDLTARMLPCSGTTCGGPTFGNHGTHTAGIMAGDGSSGITDTNGFLRGLGMAPGASLIEQVYGIVWENPDRMEILMQQSVLNNAVVSGNSWGPSGIPQGYDYDTRLVDIGVRDADPDTTGNQPLTYVLSIMNGYGGTSTQGTPDEAKNILTVGSTYLLDVLGNQRMNIDDISSNSAHGPALDGRTIPHLVAPGAYVDSTYPDASHALLGGTSMSSPHVTGAVALFYEAYRQQFSADPSPALVKAAFLPVAHDLAGHLDADGATLGHPFDSKQGWGRLNVSAVVDPTGEVWYFDQETVFEDTGESWSTTLTLNQEATQLRAMLVWTDAPGHGLGTSIPAWVNDLNLSVKVNGQSYFGNQFGPDGYSIIGGSPDFMNNTEGIFLNQLPPGEITFTVTAANISGDGVPNIGDETDQDFALVIYAIESKPIFEFIFPIFYR